LPAPHRRLVAPSVTFSTATRPWLPAAPYSG
jgi:hypothetical protein